MSHNLKSDKVVDNEKRVSTTDQDLKQKNLMSSKHFEPNRGVNGFVRRRSSGLSIKQLEAGSRRLSQVSAHSLALAIEIKRKSVASLKSTPEESAEAAEYAKSDDGKDSESALEGEEGPPEMSFALKLVYTATMLYIHHNFVIISMKAVSNG